MAIKKIGDHLNKKVQLDSKHIFGFLGVVLLFVGLVVFVGMSVTGKVSGVSHIANEITISRAGVPEKTVGDAIEDLYTKVGTGGVTGIPICPVGCSGGSEGVSCDPITPTVIRNSGSYACVESTTGAIWTIYQNDAISTRSVDLASQATFATNSVKAQEAQEAAYSSLAGFCTILKYKDDNGVVHTSTSYSSCPVGSSQTNILSGQITMCCVDPEIRLEMTQSGVDATEWGLDFINNIVYHKRDHTVDDFIIPFYTNEFVDSRSCKLYGLGDDGKIYTISSFQGFIVNYVSSMNGKGDVLHPYAYEAYIPIVNNEGKETLACLFEVTKIKCTDMNDPLDSYTLDFADFATENMCRSVNTVDYCRGVREGLYGHYDCSSLMTPLQGA